MRLRVRCEHLFVLSISIIAAARHEGALAAPWWKILLCGSGRHAAPAQRTSMVAYG